MADINTSPLAVTSPADERQQAIESLYLGNFSLIRELCESDPTLSFDTTAKVSEALAGYLSNYNGPLTDESFAAWLRGIVLPALSFAAIYKECGEYIRAAIRKVLLPCADLGLAEYHFRDAEQATWLWAWKNIELLRAPNQKAKPKTRLYAKARFNALSVRKTALRAKARFKDVGLARLGVDPNSYDWCGLIIEPLPAKEERDDPYQRTETVVAYKPSRPK